METKSNMYGKRKKAGKFANNKQSSSRNLLSTSPCSSEWLAFLDPPPGITVNFEFLGICAIIAGISFLTVAIRENIKNTYCNIGALFTIPVKLKFQVRCKTYIFIQINQAGC